jgi:hypothetical protein
VEKEAVIGNKKRLWIKRADIKRIFCSKLTCPFRKFHPGPDWRAEAESAHHGK